MGKKNFIVLAKAKRTYRVYSEDIKQVYTKS